MIQSNEKILVLGTSGQQGGAVAQHLLESGFTNVHAFVRSAQSDRARLLAEQGITLEIGDIDDSTSLKVAMKDAYGVFSVMPFDMQGPEVEIRRGQTVADVAEAAQVRHFVYSSAAGADRSDGVADFYAKYVIEEHIRELGLPASIVRPAGFMENLMTFEHPRLVDGVAVIRVAIHPDIKRQMIATDDIGLIVADLFARPNTFIGKTFEIASDEASGLEMVQIYSKVTGQPARYEEQPIEEVQAFNPDFARMINWQNEHSFGADLAHLRATYPHLTTFEAWLTRHRAAVMPQ